MSENESQAGADVRDEQLVSMDVPNTNGSEPGLEPEQTQADEIALPPAVAEDDGAAFLADLARAMQATAAAEHVRITEEAQRRQAAHIEGIRARAEIEADGLRANLEQDVTGIDAWAEGEIERIRLERERRIAARRQALEAHLERHKSLVEREVEGVDSAVAAYRSEVDAVFEQLSSEPDPATIGRLARTRPPFPQLDEVGAAARAKAMAELATAPTRGGEAAPEPEVAVPAEAGVEEAPLVAVMGESPPSAGETPWAAPSPAEREEAITSILEDAREAEAQVASEGEPEPAPVTPRSSGALLESIPTRRPVSSWWQRGGSQDDRSGPER